MKTGFGTPSLVQRVSLSPSRLRDYFLCPLKFKLVHMERKGTSQASPALSVGSTIHAVLENYFSPDRDPEQPFDLADVLKKCWIHKGYQNEKEAQTYYNLTQKTLQKFLSGPVEPKGKILATECYFGNQVRMEEGLTARLSCKIDRLDELPDGQLQVLDYKTNRNGEVATRDTLVNDLSFFLYYLLTRVNYPQYDDAVVTIWNVISGQRITVSYTDEERETNKTRLIDAIRTLFTQQEFTPKKGYYCRWCPAKDLCPAQNQELMLEEIF